jgi:hypothetical protein
VIEYRFLRLSLVMTQEGITAFTNIRIVENLDEVLDLLKAGDRSSFEEHFGLTLEYRMTIVKHMRSVLD